MNRGPWLADLLPGCRTVSGRGDADFVACARVRRLCPARPAWHVQSWQQVRPRLLVRVLTDCWSLCSCFVSVVLQALLHNPLLRYSLLH